MTAAPRLDLLPVSAGLDLGADPEVPVAPGETIAGRYRVERVLAEGGMGVVCLGRHIDLEQPVAIKFLKKALSTNPAIVERFLNEARAAAALKSPHVVRVMDVGQLETGRPYLVMERLEGFDLDALVEREGALGLEEALDFTLQACEALREAHAAGIIHRDIKPENLFICRAPSGQKLVKVVDFGLAKRVDAARSKVLTGPQDSMGSPCYMSPEQIVSPRSVDARTDVWSLGVVLYRLVTGLLPFDGDSITQVCARVLHADPRPMSEMRPGVDRELEAIVKRCLEKDLGRRYGSIAELADALVRYRDGMADTQFVSLRPSSVRELRRSRRRHHGSAWLVLLCCLAPVAAGLYQADRAGRIHLRALTDGRLTPAPLAADVFVPRSTPPVSWVVEPNGVVASDSLRAEREVNAPEDTTDESPLFAPELEAQAGPPEDTSGTLTPVEIERRKRAYRAYLNRRGLTPLREVLGAIEQSAPR